MVWEERGVEWPFKPSALRKDWCCCTNFWYSVSLLTNPCHTEFIDLRVLYCTLVCFSDLESSVPHHLLGHFLKTFPKVRDGDLGHQRQLNTITIPGTALNIVPVNDEPHLHNMKTGKTAVTLFLEVAILSISGHIIWDVGRQLPSNVLSFSSF